MYKRQVLQILAAPDGDLLLEGVKDAAGGHISWLVQLGQRRDETGHFGLEHMIAVVKLPLDDDGVPFDFDILSIGDHRDTQVLGDLGSHLGGVAVDGLASGDDQVEEMCIRDSS